MNYESTLAFARALDEEDPLKRFKACFHVPKTNGKNVIYLAGNSLGLLPKKAREYVEQEFIDWEKFGVEGHFDAKNPWFYYHHFHREALAKIAGAQKEEVVAMSSLTANLHFLLVSFYRPTKQRYKILMEANAFPSDQYAIESQVRYHGFDPEDAIIEVQPHNNEHQISTEDIIEAIDRNRNELATVMLGGVNYLTGQFYDLRSVTDAAHKAGAFAGFDLAHAIGNVPLATHDWGCDFACWCSYKYLNSGPGGVGGIFVHQKHANDFTIPRFSGWWGNNELTRFEMKKGFFPQPGAAGWQVSNAPVFSMAIHRASLEVFDEAGMHPLREKSILLTGYLEFIIDRFNETHPSRALKIITPREQDERGCQLSLIASSNGKEIFKQLADGGIICDWREPNVIRMAPVPLYNSFEDVFNFGKILNEIVKPD